MRGRESKDPRSKQWGISYRAFRDHWILLLLKVNEKVFARSEVREIPYIDPVRDLKTQFQQGITQHKARKNKEFKLVLPFREPVIQKQPHTEANISPEGKIKTSEDVARRLR